MMIEAECYFLRQLANEIGDANDVIATGYLRTFLRNPGGRASLTTFVDAAGARGYFLALTGDRLLAVQTRAPATSAPLLENKGILAIPLSSVRKVILDTDLFVVESEPATLALQLVVVNRSFPRQGALLEALAQRFNVPVTVAAIQAAQRKAARRKSALMAVAVAAGLLWGALRHH
jgi:hypothetical protein